ncbi:MAG TPA: hypothetical protein VFA38_05495 [Nitrospirales bacterium]|nr:hypothetical protein [Nitrospirales bacterium]
MKLAGSLLLFALLLGCEVPQLITRIVYEDPTNFVRLEPDPGVLPEAPETAHSQPANIPTDQMARVLRGFWVREHRNSIQVRWSGLAPQEPAFTDEEIALLASKLSEALTEAGPAERVTFYLSRPQTSIKREITSGGLFVHDNFLHFILSNYRIVYGIPAYGMVYDRRYPLMPTAPKGFDVIFTPPTAVVEGRHGLWDRIWGREKDEVVIDLRKLRGSPSAG